MRVRVPVVRCMNIHTHHHLQSQLNKQGSLEHRATFPVMVTIFACFSFAHSRITYTSFHDYRRSTMLRQVHRQIVEEYVCSLICPTAQVFWVNKFLMSTTRIEGERESENDAKYLPGINMYLTHAAQHCCGHRQSCQNIPGNFILKQKSKFAGMAT